MKKFLAVLFALMFVFSLTACKSVSNSAESLPDQDLVKYKADGTPVYDNAEYYYNYYKELVEEYGEAKLVDGKLQGVAVVRLMNFVGSDKVQLYVAYADGTKDYVNKQMVCGFDHGPTFILDKEASSVSADVTSMASADAKAPSIWLYTGSDGKGYIATGEDMSKSPVLNGYVSVENGEKIYSFQALDNIVDGEYEKINLVDLTEEDFEELNAKNKEVVERLEDVLSSKSDK